MRSCKLFTAKVTCEGCTLSLTMLAQSSCDAVLQALEIALDMTGTPFAKVSVQPA